MRTANGKMPAKEWLDGLAKPFRGRFRAAAEIAETTLTQGRAMGGRVELVRTSEMRLHELRVTAKGSTPPHFRLLFLRRGTVLWATHGFTKQSRKLDPREIERGDRIAREWIRAQGH